jgi:hypothetical protein
MVYNAGFRGGAKGAIAPGIHIDGGHTHRERGRERERESTTQVGNDLFLVNLVHHRVVCETRGIHDDICPGPRAPKENPCDYSN